MENEKLAQDFIENHDDVNLESTTNESDDNISNIIIPSIGLVSIDTSSDDFTHQKVELLFWKMLDVQSILSSRCIVI